MGVISLVRGQQSEDNYYLIDAVKTENKAETTRTTPEQNSDSVVENVVLWVKLCEINYPNMERWFSTMTLIFPFLYDRLQFEGCWEHWFDTKLFYSRTTSSLRLPLRLLDILIITPITAADSQRCFSTLTRSRHSCEMKDRNVWKPSPSFHGEEPPPSYLLKAFIFSFTQLSSPLSSLSFFFFFFTSCSPLSFYHLFSLLSPPSILLPSISPLSFSPSS